MNPWPRIYRIGWIALIALSAIGAASLFLPRYNRLRKMQREKIELQQEIVRLEARIKELSENQRRFETDPAFLERMARERGLIKPHEKVFRVSGPSADEPTP